MKLVKETPMTMSMGIMDDMEDISEKSLTILDLRGNIMIGKADYIRMDLETIIQL